MSFSHEHDATPRERLVASAVHLISEGGVHEVRAARVCAHAKVSVPTLTRQFGRIEGLIVAAAELLCDAPMFPAASPAAPTPASGEEILRRLAAAHRDYVDDWPERFSALVHLSTAAVFGPPQLRNLLITRQVSARSTVAAHLWPLRTRGFIDARRDIAGAASAFVDAAVGIELCFLIDPSPAFRVRAYDEACATYADRLW